MRWLLLFVMLLMTACGISEKDFDIRMTEIEQIRIQREMLEIEKLRLWLDYRGNETVNTVDRPINLRPRRTPRRR